MTTRLPANRRGWELLSGREAAESPNRHVLSRSVGNDMFVAVEINDVQVQKGDCAGAVL